MRPQDRGGRVKVSHGTPPKPVCASCGSQLRKSPGRDEYVCSGPGACNAHWSFEQVRNRPDMFTPKESTDLFARRNHAV
jgi:hypothetical protein